MPTKSECNLCQGKGWFVTVSGWPTECHRCDPKCARVKRINRRRKPEPLTSTVHVQPKEQPDE